MEHIISEQITSEDIPNSIEVKYRVCKSFFLGIAAILAIILILSQGIPSNNQLNNEEKITQIQSMNKNREIEKNALNVQGTEAVAFGEKQDVVMNEENEKNSAQPGSMEEKIEKQQNMTNLKQSKQIQQKLFSSEKTGSFSGSGENLRLKHAPPSEKLMSILQDLYKQRSAQTIVDFGGGMCQYAEELAETGYEVQCYDGNSNTAQETKFGQVIDLSEPNDLGKKFDWVQSFQVGEHIPEQKSHNYLDTITKHAKDGLIMSWAHLGQGGVNHINQKSNQQVIELIHQRGLRLNSDLTIKYRKMANKWFVTNLMIFQRSDIAYDPEEDFALIASKIEIREDPFFLILKEQPLVAQNSIELIFGFSKSVEFTNNENVEEAFQIDASVSPTNYKCLLVSDTPQLFNCTIDYQQGVPQDFVEIITRFKYRRYGDKYALPLKLT